MLNSRFNPMAFANQKQVVESDTNTALIKAVRASSPNIVKKFPWLSRQ